MKKIHHIAHEIIIATIIVFLIPVVAQAIVIEATTPSDSIAPGSIAIVDVMIDAEGNNINAVSGEIYFPSEFFSVEAIYERDSVITLWVEPPKQISSGLITWSGIIPGGYDGTLDPYHDGLQRGRLFSITLRARGEGTAILEFSKIITLAHDGLGTQLSVDALPRAISITNNAPLNDSASFLAEIDRDPPEQFTPVVTKDENIFDGLWFVVFITQDKGSGVRSYDIFESRRLRDKINESEWITATSPYKLKDQSLTRYIYMRATDYANNQRIVVLPPEKKQSQLYKFLQLFGIIIGVVLLLFIWKHIRRFRNVQ